MGGKAILCKWWTHCNTSVSIVARSHLLYVCTDNSKRIVALNGADGNMRQFIDALEGEKMIDSYKTLYIASNLPNILRSFVRKVVDKRRASLLGSVSELYFNIFFNCNKRLYKYFSHFFF